jgi:aminocarboxymuconate-semialdehyde decarboxylase
MPIDVHAHCVPRRILEALEECAGEFGMSLVPHPPHCPAIQFDHGVKLRPFFPQLLEDAEQRLGAMDEQGVDRQVLSLWADMFGYGLPPAKRARWHRLLNETLSRHCQRHPRRFSMLASVPLPDAAGAARELEFAVGELGAVGAVIAANVDGVNLGELPLDEFWQAASSLDVPVFIHPTQPAPLPRTGKFALGQIAQYTHDTTLAVGSLIFSGVLDRFPALRLLLSHGGGTFPYLVGRFDCLHERMDRVAQGDVASAAPSAYLKRFHYDTILHEPRILRWLAELVSVERIVLGSDYSFPPADRTPVQTVRAAGFSPAEIELILERNPRQLFSRLPA